LYFSLGSSPIANDFQFLYLFKMFIIAKANLSNPLAALSLPVKSMIFSFFGNFLYLFILGYIVWKFV